jgi:hypothetical protein
VCSNSSDRSPPWEIPEPSSANHAAGPFARVRAAGQLRRHSRYQYAVRAEPRVLSASSHSHVQRPEIFPPSASLRFCLLFFCNLVFFSLTFTSIPTPPHAVISKTTATASGRESQPSARGLHPSHRLSQCISRVRNSARHTHSFSSSSCAACFGRATF